SRDGCHVATPFRDAHQKPPRANCTQNRSSARRQRYNPQFGLFRRGHGSSVAECVPCCLPEPASSGADISGCPSFEAFHLFHIDFATSVCCTFATKSLRGVPNAPHTAACSAYFGCRFHSLAGANR